MKRFLIAVVVTCVLSASAFAGDVPTVGAPAPASNGGTEATKLGDIPSGGKPGEISTSGAPEQLSSDALSVALSLLSFLAV